VPLSELRYLTSLVIRKSQCTSITPTLTSHLSSLHNNQITSQFATEYTLEKCKMLAEKVSSINDLPLQCKKYPEAVKAASIQRTATKQAFEGMQGGLAAQAQKAKGGQSHAQIQRRLTNSRRFTKQN
jgi:hypothetical protein